MNGTAAIRVLIVDDDSLVRQKLTQMLTIHPEIEAVGQASTGDEALSNVSKLQPNIVAMDIRMPRMDGIAATSEMKLQHARENVRSWPEYEPGYAAYAPRRA